VKLPELLTVYRRRREDAERHGAQGKIAQFYAVVIAELEDLEAVSPEQKLTAQEVAEIEGVTDTTIRRQCKAGQWPGAEKTSGETGEWRIPARLVLRGGRDTQAKGRRPLDYDG